MFLPRHLSHPTVGRLTDDDLDLINGKREQFIGRVQARCGIAKSEAERQADEFLKQIR